MPVLFFFAAFGAWSPLSWLAVTRGSKTLQHQQRVSETTKWRIVLLTVAVKPTQLLVFSPFQKRFPDIVSFLNSSFLVWAVALGLKSLFPARYSTFESGFSPKGACVCIWRTANRIHPLSETWDLWLVKVSPCGLDLLTPENRVGRRCRSLVFSLFSLLN